MTALPISNPPPAPRETLYSYLSRLAATWQTEITNLTYDMGAPFKRFLEQAPEAFEALEDWADLDPRQLEELRSWTGVRVGNARMTFRGNVMVSRALRNPIMRGCPVCLREDAAGLAGAARSAMVMRGDWQMREVILCVRHRHPLVPLWTADKLRDRYDFGARLSEIEADILSGALDRGEMTPRAYDHWLDGRLEGGRDDTWFKGQPLFAATTFCRLLGQALLCENHPPEDCTSYSFHAAGFDVAKHGETAIREALDGLAAAATGALDEPPKAFGALYRGLDRDYAGEEGFAIYSALLRDCVLAHWPIAPGQVLLGEVVPKRRLHSLVTAAKEISVGASVIEHFLIEVGAIAEHDERTQSRRIFDAQAHASLLTEIPTLVGPIAMREAMGATKRELVALEEEGILIPRTRITKVKNPWRISDGTALIAELQTDAVPVSKNDEGWETLLLSRRRTRGTLAALIEGIRRQQLPVGQLAGIFGFHGVVVSKKDVDHFLCSRQAAEFSGDAASASSVSAAEFGRAVGLRNHGCFIALIKAGHTSAHPEMNAMTRRLQYRLSAADISSFHRRFVTLTTLSAETGLHRNTLKGLLAASRVNRFAPNGQDFGPVYLRAEAIIALGVANQTPMQDAYGSQSA